MALTGQLDLQIWRHKVFCSSMETFEGNSLPPRTPIIPSTTQKEGYCSVCPAKTQTGSRQEQSFPYLACADMNRIARCPGGGKCGSLNPWPMKDTMTMILTWESWLNKHKEEVLSVSDPLCIYTIRLLCLFKMARGQKWNVCFSLKRVTKDER